MDPMHVDRYLSRIGFAGPAEPRLEVLRSVHTRHLLSVPFENLSVHSGGRVQLGLPLLYDKIVAQRRGGFCCENNGLFAWLLAQLGFQVTLLSAQVKRVASGRYGPPFDHLLLTVRLGGQRWLCDVGFGSAGFSSPVLLEPGVPQEQGHRAYRVREASGTHYLEWQGEEGRGPAGDWAEIYKFTLEPRRLEDFEEMCRYHQSSPCSIFFCKSICTVLKPDGRLTYMGSRLSSTTYPSEATGAELKTTTRELKDQEIAGVLAEGFGVVLAAPLVPKDEAVVPVPDIY